MANKFDLDALKASNFESAARTHVEKAYLLLTGEAQESIEGRDVEELRGECQRIVALERINTAAPVEPKVTGVGRMPNLTVGAWEGRKRRVTIIDPDHNSEKRTVTLIYNGLPWDVSYGVQVDMPWPYWEILKNAVAVDDRSVNVVDWERDKKGKLSKVITAKETPVHNYVDHGDTPGTESLPTSYFEFFQRRAAATNCFQDAKIPMLLLIYERLYDNPPLDRNYNPVQLDAIQLRVKIAQKLGPQFVSQLNAEIFEAA